MEMPLCQDIIMWVRDFIFVTEGSIAFLMFRQSCKRYYATLMVAFALTE